MNAGVGRSQPPWLELLRSQAFSVLVVEGEAPLREAMVVRLRELGAGEVIEAASVGEARVRAHAGGPRDLCLLDFALLSSDSALLPELRATGWRRILVVSATDDPFALRAAFSGGARGYLLSPRGARRRGARPVQGRPGLPVLPAQRLPVGWAPQPTYGLTAREVEVLGLVAEGRSNRDAGDRLELSAFTVKSHLARISRKLGTGDRAEMVIVALRAGVIS